MFDASGNLEAFFFFAAWGRLWLLLLLGVHPFFFGFISPCKTPRTRSMQPIDWVVALLHC
jgi:hypothetical protein